MYESCATNDMNTDKRKPDESFIDYKDRMRTQRKAERNRLQGRVIPMPKKSIKTRRIAIERRLKELGVYNDAL